MTVPKCYFANALTGGADGCLDVIDGAGLVDDDAAIVVRSSGEGFLFYRLVDAEGQGSESSPTKIVPNLNAGNKMWILQSMLKGQISDFAHASTHGSGSSDPVTLAKSQISDFSHASTHGSAGGDAVTLARSQISDFAHASTHNNGGSDLVTPSWSDVASKPSTKFIAKRTTSTQVIDELNTWETIIFNGIITNVGSGYSASTGIFTAPANGYYAFSWDIQLDSIDSGCTYYALQLVTSNRSYTYLNMFNSSTIHSVDSSFNHIAGGVGCVDMDASDTAKLQILQYNGASDQTAIHYRGSYFAGHIIL